MTASKAAKQEGYKSLQHVANLVGTSRENLCNWHNKKPNLFRCILIGAKHLQVCPD